MLCTTMSAPLSRGAYVAGRSISARSHVTLCAHGGGVDDAVTVSHRGSPERLESCKRELRSEKGGYKLG
jgi:hypothetical protein